MGQECTSSPNLLRSGEADFAPATHSPTASAAVSPTAGASGKPRPGFAKRNSLITPAPGTCGTAFRRKNRLCVYSDRTHDLFEVPYSDKMRLEELIQCVAKASGRIAESICIAHNRINYSISSKAHTQRTLRELGIEDNAILSLADSPAKDHNIPPRPGTSESAESTRPLAAAGKSRVIRSRRRLQLQPPSTELWNSTLPTLLKGGATVKSSQAATARSGKTTNPFEIDFRIYAAPDLLGARRSARVCGEREKRVPHHV